MTTMKIIIRSPDDKNAALLLSAISDVLMLDDFKIGPAGGESVNGNYEIKVERDSAK